MILSSQLPGLIILLTLAIGSYCQEADLVSPVPVPVPSLRAIPRRSNLRCTRGTSIQPHLQENCIMS